MNDIYNNINDYNPTRKKIVLDDITADIMTYKSSSHNLRNIH